MYQAVTDRLVNCLQSHTVSATMTDGFQARFVPHNNGGFMVAVTPGWGVIKTVAKMKRKPQLSPAALGIRGDE